jgi:hypothetical protein
MFKTLILARDLLSLAEAAAALVAKFPGTLSADLDSVMSDAANLVTSPSFDGGEALLADVKAAFAAAVAQYNTGDAVVQAFKDAVAKLIADARP